MRKTFLILLISILLSCNSTDERTKRWIEDIEFLKTELPKKHVDLFFSVPQDEFDNRLTKIISNIDYLADYEITLKLQQVIAKMGDSHTTIDYSNSFNNTSISQFERPVIRIDWIKDGYYCFPPFINKKVGKINSFEIDQIIDSLSTLVTVDNQSILRKSISGLINNVGVMIYFGFIDTLDFKYIVETEYGEIIATAEAALDTLKKNDKLRNSGKKEHDWFKTPPINQFKRFGYNGYFDDTFLKDDGLYYIQYNKCWSRETEMKYGNFIKALSLPSFKKFSERILETIEKENISKLVFDLRFNRGGSSPQGTELIKKISEIEKINQPGKIFVLIGKHTFSSAILNAMDFKRYTEAIFVGEETGGSPNHYGEVKEFELPNSGLTVSYSTKYFKRTDGGINTLRPDYIIESSYDDILKGNDPIYDWIMNYN